MRVALALGVAFAAMTMVAYAQPQPRVMVWHGGGGEDSDADHDGWISRAEASAAAERMFAELDSNHDDRLTRDDRPAGEDFQVRVGGPGESTPDGCTRTSQQTDAGERITVICNGDDASAGLSDRTVTIMRTDRDGDHGDAVAPMAPMPPMPPHPPMFMMSLGGDSESDLNGDGALSLEEFRAEHLRFFDARDANRDGRVRFEAPPAPPEPPQAPQPPTPPSPRHH